MSSTMSTAAPAATSASPQGGIIEGVNPIAWNPGNPISLFIVQACIIIIFCRLLHYPLSKLGQPPVIAEVLGGIILGPSVMMRIPGFKENIFPKDSMPVLNNVANLGLLLFLFLIALEVDTRMFRSNWRVALSVGLAGMVVPFGLGVAVAYGLYHQFSDEPGLAHISFGVFALFVGTALAITAFPVLCRILSELQLLSSPVGVTVLAAGVGNDVTGWVLLALCVALVNNASGLAALYVFLAAVGWVLFLTFAVRPVFMWILRRTNSIQNGPSPSIVALTLLLVLVSAFFTASIGVHPIFGAFLAGVICPHEGGFAIKLTEKIEDLVSVLLLPLYFALSGLSTDLGLLDDGITWGYVIAIIAIAFFGKIAGGMLAARACSALWRESMAIGVLMSCKGLVELIVLNIGLQARILSDRTFTMFVVMAVVTTVATSPLVRVIYPLSYRRKVEKWKRGEIDWEGNPITTEAQAARDRLTEALDKRQTSRLLVHLRLDTMPSLFGLVALFGDAKKNGSGALSDVNAPYTASAEDLSSANDTSRNRTNPLEVRGVRLLELTDRTSSVMQSAELDELASHDPVFSTFQTFSQLNGVAVAGHIATVSQSYYSQALIDHANDTKSDLILVPWSAYGNLTEDTSLSIPIESSSLEDRFMNRTHIDFVQETLTAAICTTAIFIDPTADRRSKLKRPMLTTRPTGISVQSARDTTAQLVQPSNKPRRIFLPFVGGSDDQAALMLVLQLARSSRVSVTIAHVSCSNEDIIEEPGPVYNPDTSEKEATMEVFEQPTSSDTQMLSGAKQSVLSNGMGERVQFVDVDIEHPADIPVHVVQQAKDLVRKSKGGPDDLVIVGRKQSCLGGVKTTEQGLKRDFQIAVGVLGEALAMGEVNAGVLVIHAGQVVG